MDIGTTSKGKKGKIAIGLGAFACVLACAAPLAGAAGVGAVTIGWFASSMEIAAGLLVLGGVGAIAVEYGRRRAPVDEGCGCSLDNAAMEHRLGEFRAAFDDAYLGDETIPGGTRWRFRNAPGQAAELKALAAKERVCCPSIQFDVQIQGDEIWWDMRT